MFVSMKNEVTVDNNFFTILTEKLHQIDPTQRLQIALTVFKADPMGGLDRYYSNTIRVRCTNVGRQKGEPRELEFFHKVWCVEGTVVTKTRFRRKIVPDTRVIEKLIDDYSKFGDVTVRRNDLPLWMDNDYLAIVDDLGNILDVNANIIESFNSFGEALRASRRNK